ncbi:FUSC family membrane protein [soil metagenome]
MLSSRDYLREVKKFATSHYWNTGLRITAGVMLPTIVLEHFDWLAVGMPFLWGALFVSITDSPGPINHRRNGLLAGVAFNTFTVFITASLHEYQAILIGEIVLLTFFYSLFGIFGNRAGAIGVLTLIVMLLNLVPHSAHTSALNDSLMIMGGGLWYTAFSLLLYRIRPYRLAEQSIGENLIAIADYLRARALLYKEGENIDRAFNGVIGEQINVLKCQEMAGEILFKTRQFVADASPRGRSMMMIFIDSKDLLEEVMSAHQDYKRVHEALENTGLLDKFHGTILLTATELERIGLIIQSGDAVKDDVELTSALEQLEDAIQVQRLKAKVNDVASLDALENTLSSIRRIASLMQRLIEYTRLEVKLSASYTSVVEANKTVIGQPIVWNVLLENLSIKSNTFRHAIRLTIAVVIGYLISHFFSLSHAYWVLLTIVTILKPVYAVSRQRNIQRLSGTLLGALLASIAIYFISDRTILLAIMVFSMALSYSFLRINYLGFVVFLTIYIIISFHFLNPAEFTTLIEQRIVDTLIGSAIAAIAARFVLPVWGTEEIDTSLREMIKAQYNYFNAVILMIGKVGESKDFNLSRKDAVVALTNLSDNFQRILTEPKKTHMAEQINQFVITSHVLTGHIASLAQEKISNDLLMEDNAARFIELIRLEFDAAINNIPLPSEAVPEPSDIGQLAMIYALTREIRLINSKIIPKRL